MADQVTSLEADADGGTLFQQREPRCTVFQLGPNYVTRTTPAFFHQFERRMVGPFEHREVDLNFPWRAAYDGLDAVAKTASGAVSMIAQMLERREGRRGGGCDG